MPHDIIILLILSSVTVILFTFETFPADVTALGLMLSLILFGMLTPEEAFRGFGSDTVLMILGLLIMSSALYQTGVVDMAGQIIFNLTEKNKNYTLLIITCSVALLSSFISNTAATAFFLPALIGFARKSKQSSSKFLLPLAFASILSSSVTLISSSTNIIISELLIKNGQKGLGMFELAPIGIPIAIVGIIYLITIGTRLMPQTNPDDNIEDFGLKPYLSEIILLEDSSMIGKKLTESEIVKNLQFNIIRIIRKKRYIVPRASSILKAGDVLLVEGGKDQILSIKDIEGIEIKPEAQLSPENIEFEEGREPSLVEAIIPHKSRFIGKSLKDIGFRDRYNIIVLAINRAGLAINKKMSQSALNIGDIILIQGDKNEIQILNDNHSINIIGSVLRNKINRNKAPIAIGVFVGSLTLATLNIISFPVASLLGAFFVFVSGCITPEGAYREVDWKVLILIACMISLGTAMEKTGTGVYLSNSVIALLGSGQLMILSGFFVFAVVLTQVMSNQAAAIVLIPIAIPTAQTLGLDPRGIVVTIAVAASCSYLTPLEPACLMVYGPGKYRFRDFFIVGLPLTLIIYFMVVTLVPLYWPLAK